MATTTRTFLTGSVALLLACLAWATDARAEFDPALANLVVDPVFQDGGTAVPAVWSGSVEGVAAARRWDDVFGEPSHALAPRLASFTPPAEPAPRITVATMPSIAYRVHDNRHVRFFIDRFRTGDRRAVVESWLARAGRYLPMILDVFRQKGLPDELVFTSMIESVQREIPGRVSDPRDVAANSIGMFVGIGLAVLLTLPATLRRRRRRDG